MTFEIGDSFFTQNWVTAPASTDARDGLGPTFNAQACSSCHLRDGRGTPASTGDGDARSALADVRARRRTEHGGAPVPHPVYGDQLQDRSNVGVPAEGELVISYDRDRPASTATARRTRCARPTYDRRIPAFGPLGDDVMISPRLAPQVIGMGLLEADPRSRHRRCRAIPTTTTATASPGDRTGSWNPAHRATSSSVGSAGRRTSPPSRRRAPARSTATSGSPRRCSPTRRAPPAQDVCAAEPERWRARDHRRPARQRRLLLAHPGGARDARRRRRRRCATVPTRSTSSAARRATRRRFTTGDADVAALADQTIHPYTDLLLHDMGAGPGRRSARLRGVRHRMAHATAVGASG